MMKSLATSVAVAVVLLVAGSSYLSSAQGEFNIITITTCEPGSKCAKNCTDWAVVNQGECYQPFPSGEAALRANCSTSPGVCVEVDYYTDSKCQVPSTTLNAVCSSCQTPAVAPGFFYIECGALPDGVFLVYNCTDLSCGSCSNDKVVTFDQCQNVEGQFFIVRRPYDCRTVAVTRYNNTDCSGNGNDFQFPDGICSEAATVRCSTSPTQVPVSSNRP
jgi:hypothetical protein